MVTNKYRITRSAGGLPALSWVRLAFAFLILSMVLALPSGRGLAQSGPPQEVLEGTVEVLHEDRDVGSRYIYFLRTATERLELQFASDPPALATGDRIRARGLRTNGVLALVSGSSTTPVSSGVQHTFGWQPTLVMLVTFQDNPTQPYTVASAQSVMATTSSFDLENSFQQTALTSVVDTGEAADVRGWYTIPVNSNNCDYNSIASYAKQAAAADGVILSNYGRYVYAFPSNSGCTWWGLGTVGGWPSSAWVNGSLQIRVVGHEMGHNLGLYHSHSMSCDTSGCTTSEYGDSLDIMGSANPGHFNAYQKERLGWLNYNNNVSPAITSVTADGSYNIFPYEAQTTDPKALKILKSSDSTGNTYYYVEYRTRVGYDSGLINGVVVHTGKDSDANSTYLWDLDQTTTTSDYVLNVGQSYTDSTAGVTMTVLSMDSTGASVSVTSGGGGGGGSTTCAPAAPTVTISPSGAVWVAAGGTAAYSVTVTNNDGSSCAPSTFNLTAAVPSGWGAPGSSLSLSPGTSGTTTLSVTSPAAAPAGLYTIPVTATNSSSTAYYGTANAIELLTANIDVKLTTDSSSYVTNSFVNFNVNARDGSLTYAAVGGSVTVTGKKGDGSPLAPITGTIDSSGNFAATFKITKNDPTGPWQIQATVTKDGVSGINSTSITVTSGSGSTTTTSTGGGFGKGGKPK